MLTGTPLDLTPFGGLLSAIGTIYWILVLVFVAASLWFPKNWLVKLGLAAAVIGVMVVPVVLDVKAKRELQAQANARLAAAMAHYEMRCKGAGEKITRTVENVEGVLLMKIRYHDKTDDPVQIQFRMNDPYGKDSTDGGYIESFLFGRNENGWLDHTVLDGGYRFVEAIDPQDGKLYRYTGALADPNHYKLNKALSVEPGPRFGITYDDISTVEDRKMWVAGSSLRVIDLKTNEVIAERIGFMIDRGQGSEAGFRNPWAFAAYNACPAFPLAPPNHEHVMQGNQARNFVEKVLKPIQQQGQK